MKKTVYTLAFVAFFGVMANAQTAKPASAKSEPVKAEPIKAETVNPDGTISPAPASSNAPELKAKDDNQPVRKEGTRMAITEKGVPASKKPVEATKKAEPAKTEKH